jgi:hypothetical protein
MSNYIIDKKIFEIAENLGVEIKPSENIKKKIDVFKDGKKIASIGSAGHGDYFFYLKTKGHLFAENKKDQYKKRHWKDIDNKDKNGFWAYTLLWNGLNTF